MNRMVVMIFVFLTEICSAQKETVIDVDFARNDKINLSQIVSDVRVVPLHGDKSFLIHKIQKVILSEKYIFVCDQNVVNGVPIDRVLQFDLSGTFIRQVGDAVQGWLRFATNEGDNFLFIRDENKTVKKYDYNGNYISTVNNTFNVFDAVLYHGQFWKTRASADKLELIQVKSEPSSETGKTYFISKNIVIEPIPDSKVNVGNTPSLSNTKDDLFISYRMTDRIYKFDGTKIEPVYFFRFKGVRFGETDKAPGANTFVTESMVYYEYSVNMTKRFLLLYDIKTKKSWHVRNETNKNGIEDDILNSGFVEITPLNKMDYVYFVKTADEISSNQNIPKNGSNPVLFLAQLKP